MKKVMRLLVVLVLVLGTAYSAQAVSITYNTTDLGGGVLVHRQVEFSVIEISYSNVASNTSIWSRLSLVGQYQVAWPETGSRPNPTGADAALTPFLQPCCVETRPTARGWPPPSSGSRMLMSAFLLLSLAAASLRSRSAKMRASWPSNFCRGVTKPIALCRRKSL